MQTLDLGPLTVFQQGRYFGVQPNPEHPEFEEFRKAQRQAAAQLPDRVLELRQKLAEVMAPHHAFDILFGVWGIYGWVRPDTLQSSAGDALTSTAEFVAHVLLDRPTPEPTRPPTDEELRRGADPYEIGQLVAEIVGYLPIIYTQRQLGEADSDLDPWTELRSRLYMHRLGIRSFTYDQQETETLRGLFIPFDNELHATAGFTVDEALALHRGAGELPMTGAADRTARARKEAGKLNQLVANRRKGKHVTGGYPDELLDRLTSLPTRQAEQWIEAMTASWAWHAYGRDAAFTCAELAAYAGVGPAAAQAFLELFAVEFGNREDQPRWDEDPKRALGGEMEVMRHRPIVHDGEARYLPCALDSLFYGLRDRLTDALKKDTKAWERFQIHRARLVEERAVAALATALNADWAHGSVKYELPGATGDIEQGEADGILRADSLIVLVETKAGALAPSARRTAPARLEKGLRELVEAAAHQLSRDERALVEGEATKVTDKSGKPLALDTNDVLRVLRIAVTLEDLSGVAPAAWRLQEAGLLPSDEQAPWVVGIHELELICQLVERPAQLVHYVLRRARANRQRIWAMDEMDFFMHYLMFGLFWDDNELEGSYLEVHSHTEKLDEWWFGEHGMRKPAKRPRQKLPKATRELLDDIDATGMIGRTEAQLMVLEMSTETQEKAIALMRKLLRRTSRDGEPHDMTLIFGKDMGLTFHSLPSELADEAPERLRNHGMHRANVSKLRRWLGLAAVAGSKKRLTAVSVWADPERLGQEESDQPAEPADRDSDGAS